VPGAVVAPSEVAGGAREFQRLLGGKVPVFDPFDIPGKAGRLPVRGAQTVRVAEAAAAVARCLTRSLICAAVGAAGYVFYEKYRTRPSSDGSQLERDPGQDPVEIPAYCAVQGGEYRYCDQTALGSYAAAARARHDAYCAGWGSGSGSIAASCTMVGEAYCDANGSCSGISSRAVIKREYGIPDQYNGPYGETVVQHGTSRFCPAVPDFSDPRYSVSGGPAGPDGKCPTGRYSEHPTPEQAAQKVADAAPGDNDQTLPDALKDAVKSGQTVPSEIELSGPASQTGTPTRKTTTDATGTTTVTDTPSYQYHYDGDKVRYDEGHTTETTHPDGSTSTTTTTTTGPKSEADTKDPCDLHPERVGCMSLGDAPNDQVTKRSQSVSWNAEDPNLPASCPADITVQTSRGPVVFSYHDACDTATRMAPLIKAVGAFTALMIVAATLRGA